MKLKKQKLLVDAMQDAFLDEAKQIEEEIKDVQLSENPIDKEKLRTAILTEAIETEQKENPRPKRKPMPKKIGQWAAILVMCMVGIFGFSMTSQGNRIFLVNKVEEFFGKKTDVRIHNKETVEIESSEEQARNDIEKTLEVPVPEFYYIPEGMEFVEYEQYQDAGIAKMKYQYMDKLMIFQVSGNDEDSAESTSVDGENIKSIHSERNDLDIEIWKLTNDVDNSIAYRAQWVYKNTFYWLHATMDLKEFEKILENMFY